MLQSASRYDATYTPVLLLRGTAYVRAGKSEAAIEEFGEMEKLHSLYPQDPLLPLAEIGLARAYAVQGDTSKSRSAYRNCLDLWKDADPDIPILREAKAEYAQLK